MKKIIISYSYSGNNLKLARSLAENTGSEHIEIKEIKKRKITTIVFDVIFNRTPRIHPVTINLNSYDTVVFVAPIWFGKFATPLKSVFKTHKNEIKKYAFVSISAGTNGVAPQIKLEIEKYLGNKPSALIHLLISDIRPSNQRGNRKLLDSYRLNDNDINHLVENASMQLETI